MYVCSSSCVYELYGCYPLSSSVATADSAALLYGNPQPVQLECNSRDVVWHHNESMLQPGDVSGQTRYQGLRSHSLGISYATQTAAGSYQCRDSSDSRRVLKTYSGVTVQSEP